MKRQGNADGVSASSGGGYVLPAGVRVDELERAAGRAPVRRQGLAVLHADRSCRLSRLQPQAGVTPEVPLIAW